MLTRAQAAPTAAIAPVVATIVTMLFLRLLIQRLETWRPVPVASDMPLARRSFMQLLGGTAIAAAAAGIVTTLVRRAGTVASDFRRGVALPAPVTPPQKVPDGAALTLAGLQPLVTPNPDFYRIDTALIPPAVNPPDWTLKVTGLVEREVTLDFATLLTKPMIERHVTIACVSNEVGGDLIGNALWLGWPVRELLAMAGPKPGADMVLSRSTDGWTAGTPSRRSPTIGTRSSPSE
ncbi:oxidoreductase molybdopterin binding [Arthrobacter sp. Hiyo8]|nr:oxidoreductase molybdopterin binding [Arthrobacter sp. Hiyo8]